MSQNGKALLGMLVTLLICAAHAVRAEEFLFVTTTDFITGSSTKVDLQNPLVVTKNVQSVHSDAVCRYDDGLLYVVNRYGGDNIQVLDPAAGCATIRQVSVGVGSDPHDIVVLSPHKAYVTRYNETALWIVDPAAEAVTGSIDLGAFADADGIPEMDYMARVGDYVYVTIQRLDRNAYYTPVGPSYVAVIDTRTDTLVDIDPVDPGVQAIVLAATNPFSELELDPFTGRLYVSGAGFFGLVDHGVEWIDPGTWQSLGIFFDEAAAGGDINDVQLVSPTKGYAIVADADFNTHLVSFDPTTGAKTGTVFSPGGYVLNDIELSLDQRLFVADRTPTLPGVRIFDITSDTQTTNPVDVGLPPFDLCFSTPVQTAVEPPVSHSVTLGSGFPNPFRDGTTLPFTLDRPARVRAAVYDVNGRVVRRISEVSWPEGGHAITWDGMDDAGRPVASGVYFLHLDVGAERRSTKISVVR